MSAAAWSRAGDADLVALVIDAERAHTGRGLDAWLDPVFETLPTIKRPVIAVLNKIDLVARPELLRPRRGTLNAPRLRRAPS